MANGNMFRMVTWGLTIPIVLFYGKSRYWIP